MALNPNQELLLDLMVRAEKLMRENDIKFFLFGGSTIGALRHNGFIPWDDDIDIIIDAENFYKLQKLFENGPIDNMDLVYFNNDPYWYRAYAMIVNLTDTCYTRPCMYTTGRNAGTRIDTMILDYIPSERLEEYKHDLMLYQEVLADSVIIDENIYQIKDEYYALRQRMDEIGRTAVELEMRKKLESYATPDSDELVVRYSTRAIRHYAVDTLYEPLYHDFEGYMMPVPAKPEKQLRQQYGYDWYMIPSAETYKIHRFFHNYEISGNNYHDDLQPFYDRDELQESARRNKSTMIEKREGLLENRRVRANLVAQMELMRVDPDGRIDYFEKLIADKNYPQIYAEMELITNKIATFDPVPPEHKQIPEIVMKNWLKACAYCGKYYIARKIIKSFEIAEDARYAEELDLIERVTALAEAYQDRDMALIAELKKGFTGEEPDQIPECIFADRALHDAGDSSAQTAKDLEDRCRQYLERIPENYEVMKVLADLIYEQGKTDEAMELYKTVHENTNNGLDLLYIETKFGLGPRFKGGELEDEIDRVLRDLL